MDRFEAFITGQPDQSPTLEEVCAAVGVPGRTLRACCTEFLGISPKRYLLLRRLKLVRRALRQADPRATVTVTKVALKYGFSEFGWFAGQYRAQFGESPSVTLREPPGRIVVPMSSRRSTGSPEPAAETA